jgi:hypothetical protein
VVPQSDAKQLFCCTVYYISLNSNGEAQRAYKKFEKMYKIDLEAKNNA